MRIVAVLLAAGAGRRYGNPEVLVGGWLDSAVQALRGGGCDDVILVLGAADVPVPPAATAVTAANWGVGLSESLRAGLAEADRGHADWAVVHLIDTPDVGAAVVARVVNRALASVSGLARAYLAGRPGHPVVIAGRHWPGVLDRLTGNQGAAGYLVPAKTSRKWTAATLPVATMSTNQLDRHRPTSHCQSSGSVGGLATARTSPTTGTSPAPFWAVAITRLRTRYSRR